MYDCGVFPTPIVAVEMLWSNVRTDPRKGFFEAFRMSSRLNDCDRSLLGPGSGETSVNPAAGGGVGGDTSGAASGAGAGAGGAGSGRGGSGRGGSGAGGSGAGAAGEAGAAGGGGAGRGVAG